MRFAIFFLLLLSTTLFGAQIKWANSYDDALKTAKSQNKPILLMLSQPGCPTCVSMKSLMASDELVSNEIASKFVAVEVNILKDDWNMKFRAFATPTFYFIDKNENKLSRQFIGGAPAAEFLKVLKDAQK